MSHSPPSPVAPGIVYLVGAGPGDPELITVRGLNLIRRADVVIHDRLISRQLLAEAPRDAELIDVGKSCGRPSPPQSSINELLVDKARSGRRVVRLKGGDPFVFGRGGEELLSCIEAGLECVVVPGVSSALAGPAAAGIPVTHREIARSFVVVTGQSTVGADEAGSAMTTPLDFSALVAMDTLVIMMGRSNLREIAHGLMAAGKAARTPAACIASATTVDQRVVVAPLGSIADASDRERLESPVVTVIGETVALAESLRAAAGVHRDRP